MSEIHLTLPLHPDTARSLRAGDILRVSGVAVATAGYPAHLRMAQGVRDGIPPPIDMAGAALFHMGSLSRRDDTGVMRPLYVNPTTSTRFNAFLPGIVRHFGLTVVAGKGGMDEDGVAALQQTGCVYLSMVGGAAALLTEGVTAVEATGWDDLIEQFRLSRLRLDGFGPLTVAIDAHGHSVYHDLTARARARLPAILDQLAKDRGG